MVLKRLFIGNLPENLTGEELSSKFSSFGNVEDAQVKTKNEATFGFISLYVEDEKNVKHCIDVLNNTKWKGSLIKVQLAKESFMEKLKKEQVENREKAKRPVGIISFDDEPESTTTSNSNMGTLMKNYYNDIAKGKATSLLPHLSERRKEQEITVPAEPVKPTRLLPLPTTTTTTNNKSSSNLSAVKEDSPQKKNLPTKTKSKQNDSSSDSDDSEVEESSQGLPRFRGILAYPELNAPPPPVEKKLETKLKIESVSHSIENRLLEVTESPSSSDKKTTPLNFKKRNSDQIRQKSMEARYNLNKNRSAMITNSLSHNNIEPPVSHPPPTTSAKKKQQSNLSQNLFDDDNDPEEDVGNSFKLKPQFEGKSGQKNFELSSKFAVHDNRFVIHERFKDEKEEGEEQEDGDVNLEQEKLASFSILSDILGSTVAPKLKKNTATKSKSSVIVQRYDPENDHGEDEADVEMENVSELNSKGKSTSSTKDGQEKSGEEETKVATYRVASNLKELLTSSTTGFSLLQTFGNQNGHSSKVDDDEESSPVLTKKGKGDNSFWNKQNPFKYDSSDSENEDDKFIEKVTAPSNGHPDSDRPRKLPKKERFFFSKKDKRFEGIADFFLKSTEDMSEVLYRFNNGERSELKLIFKGKIKNTKRKSDKRMEVLKRLKRKQKDKRRKKITLEGSNAVPIGAK